MVAHRIDLEDRDAGPLVLARRYRRAKGGPCRPRAARGGPRVRPGSGTRAARRRRSSRRRCRGRPGRADRDRRPSRAKASEWLVGPKSGRDGSTPCQRISGGSPSALAEKNVRRRRTGCAFRSAIIIRDEAEEVRRSAPASDQSTQLDRVVLAPGVVVAAAGCGGTRRRPGSSGRPGEIISVAIRLRTCCAAESRGPSGSSVGPSTPQFQLQLASLPSRFPSPLASLCLWL